METIPFSYAYAYAYAYAYVAPGLHWLCSCVFMLVLMLMSQCTPAFNV